ncbi:EAL and HDOD domain-containing protein [Desulfovibrio inopinatus]|uniref:EAL and HDOD domain-containing protein n=1 Tax=Desulfovibrio inopinatus TaxID=102109 RepID=UPI0003FE31AB|nr:HDOD domain-containing protein [Desulfovibrio inopinatus]
MKNELQSERRDYEPIYVAKQPIYDRCGGIFAYELLFRHAQSNTAHIKDPDQATAQVIADGFTMAINGMESGALAFINFPKGLLIRKDPLALPHSVCVVEILENVDPTPDVLSALSELKSAGYTLALDDYIGTAGFEPFLELADIIKVEILGMATRDLIRLSQRLKMYGCRLLAEKVEDQTAYDLVYALGYDYFQGYFFSRPQIIEGRKLTTTQTTRLRVMYELNKRDFEFKTMAEIISRDPALSLRLLRLINSAAFGLYKKVATIGQALPLLGMDLLRHWLMVVLLSEISVGPRSSDLAFRSVLRGRYLETLALAMKGSAQNEDTAFLLGLFSLLDALLNQPMESIVQTLALDEDIQAALCGEQCKAREWIDHVVALENDDFDQAKAFLVKNGLPVEQGAELHARAAAWTAGMLGHAVEKTQNVT